MSKTRQAEELEALRWHIAELQTLVMALAPGDRSGEGDQISLASERIKREITTRLGFFPSFFEPALASPTLLDGVWRQMSWAYLNNPIPDLFKEKLFARLSRFCSAPCAILTHTCNLRRLGMKPAEIFRQLTQPIAGTDNECQPAFEAFALQVRPLPDWPTQESKVEEFILGCALSAFTHSGSAERCREELRTLLGDLNFARLLTFLSYVRAHHLWLEWCPPLLHHGVEHLQSDLSALMAEEPALSELLQNYLEPMPGDTRASDTAAVHEELKPLSTGRREADLAERAILSTTKGMIVFDKDGVCTSWSAGMEQIFGISAKEALGRDVLGAFPFLGGAGAWQGVIKALQGEHVVVRDWYYSVPETGRKGRFEGLYSPAYGERGEVIGGMAIIHSTGDVKTEPTARQSDDDRQRELLENAFDMVFTYDLTGKLTSVNRACERLTGYTRAEALEMSTSQLFTQESQQTVSRIIDAQLGGEAPGTCETNMIAKDGRRLGLEVSFRLIYREGKAVGVQGIARDVTERKKTEEALIQANRNLETWVKELEQRTREMTLLGEMGDLLRACLTAEEVYRVIARVAQELFPVEVGAVYMISPSHDSVEATVVWGNPELAERAFVPGDCWALRRGRIHWIEDTSVGMVCKHLYNPPPGSYLCVPMMARSEALGIVYLTEAKEARLTEARQRLAVAMAEQIAMALSNLKLHETLRTQSIRDHLTGLFNRSFMQEALELELRRSARNQRPVGAIMLDLDGFKVLNETYGADAGDNVLRNLGLKLQASIRKEDVACRFGGEKFVIILPQGSLQITRQRAEDLVQLVRNLEFRHRGAALDRVTTSIGVAIYPDHGRTVDDLLRATEAALNRAKKAGGDRVVAAQ